MDRMKRTAILVRAAAALTFALALSSCGGSDGSVGSALAAAAATPATSPTTQSTAESTTQDAQQRGCWGWEFGNPRVALCASSYTVTQSAGSVSVVVKRGGTATTAISVDYATSNGTAIAGTDYTAASGVLQWAENDWTPRTIAIPIATAVAFSGNRSFNMVLGKPSKGVSIVYPGNGTVTIAGAASATVGTLELTQGSYLVGQGAGSATITVARADGDIGATSVAYSTVNGTAVAGTNFTATSGTLQWASGDSAVKSFTVPISNAAPFTGSKSFSVALSNATASATMGSPQSAAVTIAGDASAPVGSLVLAASSYTVAQNGGQLTVTVDRTGGSNGAVSVSYGTSNGTAAAGTDYTATSGVLQWAEGDTSAKTFSVPVSNATPFSGSKTFTIALSAPSAGAAIGNPGSATATISGDAAAPVGSLQLSAASYAVNQGAGTLAVTVTRTGGSSGAASVTYDTTGGSAVAGTDFTASSGTLNWASGDASSKPFSVSISNATPFSGSKAFTVALSGPTGGATLSSPSSAGVTIAGSLVVVPAGTLWVYYNGAMNWGGDWSFAASANYKDTSGGPIEGAYDIEITGEQWGGWQPYVSGNCQSSIASCFVTTPYKYLIFSAKPTVANQIFGSAVLSAGDTPDGNFLQNLSAYCSGGSNPPVGQWESCKVPLSAYSLTDLTILKFSISDQTGLSSNHYYLDNVGFSAD
jgi:Calx-beta domain